MSHEIADPYPPSNADALNIHPQQHPTFHSLHRDPTFSANTTVVLQTLEFIELLCRRRRRGEPLRPMFCIDRLTVAERMLCGRPSELGTVPDNNTRRRGQTLSVQQTDSIFFVF